MADKDVSIKVTLDGRDAEVGIRDLAKAMKSAEEGGKSTGRSFTELNQALELAQKGVSIVRSGFSELRETLGRGQDVFEVSNAFKDLQAQAGQTADQGITKLRTATQGMLADFDLMKQANLASTFGTTQEQFELLAGSADKLGGAVGKSLPEALEILNRAFGSGQERQLKELGIKNLLTDAEEKYRATLDQTGQLMFTRSKIIEAVTSATGKLSDADQTAGDAMEILDATLKNVVDGFSNSVATSTVLRDALLALNDVVKDGVPLIDDFFRGLSTFSAAMSVAKGEVENFAAAFPKLGSAMSGIWEASLAPAKALFGVIEDGLDTIADKGVNEQFKKALDMKDLASGAKSLDEVAAAMKRVREEQEKLSGFADKPGSTTDAVLKANERAKELGVIYADLQSKQSQLATGTNELSETQKKAAAIIEALRKATAGHTVANEEAAKKVQDLKNDYAKLTAELETNSLKQALETGIGEMSDADFEALRVKILDSSTAAFKESLRKYKEAGIDTEDAIAKQREQNDNELHQKRMEALEQEADKQKEMLEANITFFDNLFDTMTSTSTKDWGEMLKDMFKDVAIGAASSLAGELATSMGFDAGSFGGSAKGIGQMLASGVINSIFGTTATIGPVAGGGGVDYTGMAVNAVGTAATSYAVSSAIGAGGAAAGGAAAGGAAAGGAAAGGSMLSSMAALGPYALAAAAIYYALDRTGTLESNFGGVTNQEAIDRKTARGELQNTPLGNDLKFQGVKGWTSLSTAGPNGGKDNYNVDFSNPLASGAISLTSGLGDVLAGGKDKLGDDLTGIFANAVMEADNFNEVLANTMSLMDQMGTNAQEQKDSLTALFLEGKVSLDELNGGLAGLNIIAQENLVGKGSVADAMKIVAENIEKGPGTAMKGLELAMKEAAEIGITNMSELGAYLGDKLGPEGKAVFDRLQAAGITSFQDIQNASADQIAMIFNELTSIQDVLMDTFSGTANEAANSFTSAADKITKATKDIKNSLNSLNKDLDSTKEKSDALDKGNNGRNNNDPIGSNP